MLLAAEAWDDVEVAKSELVKWHWKMRHTDFSVVVQHLKVAFHYPDLSKLREAATTLQFDSCEKRKAALNWPMFTLPEVPHLNFELGAKI